LVVEAITNLPAHDLILDGEATGVWGKQGPATYQVFDILWLDGRNLTALLLDERREVLARLPLPSPLALVERLNGPKPWERACHEGWEGVIAKRRDSRYEHRRSPNWLKMKCEATQELVVGGFTDPKGRRAGLGALLVGYFDNDDFVFAGKVGTGFDTNLLLDLCARLQRIEIAKPPFTRSLSRESRGVHWVRPEVVVQVAFTEWTVHGRLRHPRFLGLRTDKSAPEVVRRHPQS
jgi:bifunctional non-homologous end joining protein LigD